MLDDDQWAVRDGMLEHNAGYWKQAWIDATWAVAFDFKWYLPMDYTLGALPGLQVDINMPRQTIADIIGVEVPAYLAWFYGQMVTLQPGVEDPLDRYRRSSIATAYEMFRATNGPNGIRLRIRFAHLTTTGHSTCPVTNWPMRLFALIFTPDRFA